MTPYYQDSEVIIYHGDQRQVLPALAGQYDFLLTDPPYGISYDASEKKHGHDTRAKNVHDDDKPFDARHLAALSVPSIIFGANCFASSLPDKHGWLSWVKTAPTALATDGKAGVKLRKADMELAWTNFVKRPQSFFFPWIGAAFDTTEEGRCDAGGREVRFHPTQKPIGLMRWCLDLAPKDCKVVIDPYMGGGSTLVAAAGIEGWRAIGIEIEESYCETAARRFDSRRCSQPRLDFPDYAPRKKRARTFADQ